jgi:hypothetical protein
VSALASSALPGQRILAIGGRSIQLPKSLTFTDTTHLSELQSQLVTAGPPQTDGATTANIVHATATLATAITAYGVPASAVLGTADTTCVVDGNDRSHGVHVLGSTVGKALVTFTQPSAPDTVRIAPAADRTCP